MILNFLNEKKGNEWLGENVHLEAFKSFVQNSESKLLLCTIPKEQFHSKPKINKRKKWIIHRNQI